MRSVQSKVLVLLAVLALSAVGAASAQAATEGPFFKVSGARLGSGETKVLKVSAKEHIMIRTAFQNSMECTTVTAAAGAKIVGSAGATSSGSEESLVFSGCRLTGFGEPCELEHKTLATTALKGTLGYATSTRTGRLLMLLKPVSGKVFAVANFVGSGCKFHNIKLEGSIVANLSSGRNPVEVGVNEKQAKVTELDFPTTRVTQIWTESAGALTEVKAGLTWEGGVVGIEGWSNLELEGAPEWGVFT